MGNTTEELYSGYRFNHTLESLGLEDYSLGLGGDINEREFVYARTGKWGSPFVSSDKICCVYEVYDGEPIDIQDAVTQVQDVLDERPYKMRNKDAVPSLQGQYLQVMECLIGMQDGKEYVKPRTPSYWIPVEWVRQPVRYDAEDTILDV